MSKFVNYQDLEHDPSFTPEEKNIIRQARSLEDGMKKKYNAKGFGIRKALDVIEELRTNLLSKFPETDVQLANDIHEGKEE